MTTPRDPGFPLLIPWDAEVAETLAGAFELGVRAVAADGVRVGGPGGFPEPPLDGLHSVPALMSWAYACGVMGLAGSGVGVRVVDPERAS